MKVINVFLAYVLLEYTWYNYVIVAAAIPDNVSNHSCLAVELDVDQLQLTALTSHFKVGSVVNKTE